MINFNGLLICNKEWKELVIEFSSYTTLEYLIFLVDTASPTLDKSANVIIDNLSHLELISGSL